MRKTLIVLLLVGVAALVAACAGQPKPSLSPVTLPEGARSPVTLSEGARLTGMYINHQGMAMEPHYTLKAMEDGIYMKYSYSSPLDTGGHYLDYADSVQDYEQAVLTLLTDETPLLELEAAVLDVGALEWDGYDVHKSEPGVSDSGDSYTLYLEFSDGNTVTVKGYNACPDGFETLLSQVMDIFFTYCEE